MNRIQNKDHRIGNYEINKLSLSCFDDKIFLTVRTAFFIFSFSLYIK